MTPQEMQDLSKEFARQLKIVFGNNGPGNNSNNNTNRRTSSNSIRDSEGEANYRKNFKRDLLGFSKSLRTIIDDADKVMREYTISQTGMIKLQNRIYSDIVNNEKLTNKAQERLRKRLNEWARQQSNLTSQLIDAAGNYKDINKYLEETADKLEDYNDVLEENMSTTVRGITSFKKMAKAIDKLGKSAQYQAAMQAIMAKDAQGNHIHTLSEQKQQRKELLQQLAHSIDQENEARKKSREQILGRAADMGRTAGFMAELNSIGEKALQAGGFGFLLTKGTVLLAAFVNVLAQVGEYYNRIKTSLALGQTSVFDPIVLGIQAARVGMSFEKLTAMLSENYRTMSLLGGPKGFVDNLIEFRGALNSMGEFGEAANKGVAGMLEGARVSSVDFKNRGALIDSMAKQQDAYKYLRAAINETGETFAKNNLSVLQSAEFEQKSVLLNKKRRSQLISEIAIGRKRLAESGILSSDIQMSILKQTQALLNKPVVDRFKTIGDITKAGGQLGMNKEADEVRKILLKGASATDEEQLRLSSLLTKMSEKNNVNIAEAQRTGNYGAENVGNLIAADIAKAMPDVNKIIIEKNNPNNKKDLNAEIDKRKVSDREQFLLNGIDSIISLLGDKIVKAITTLGLVIAGLLLINSFKGGIGILGFLGSLFAAVKTGILRGLTAVFGAGAAGAGGLIRFLVTGIAKLFGPVVLGISIYRGIKEIWEDPRTNSSISEKISGGISSMFAALISTAVSAVTFGMVDLDVKNVKKMIEDKLFGISGDIILLLLNATGSIFVSLAKMMLGGYKLLFNTVIDGIDSDWMPQNVRNKLQSWKFKDPMNIDFGDGGGTWQDTVNQGLDFGKDMITDIGDRATRPLDGSVQTPIRPTPLMIPKTNILSPAQLQEKVLDPANDILNKKTPEKQIDILKAMLEILKAQYALEQQNVQNKGIFSVGENIFDTSAPIS